MDIYSILFLITVAAGLGLYLFISKKNQSKVKEFIEENLNISLSFNPQITKQPKQQTPQEIIREAESLFKTLKNKYPNSPMPYKTLGDFYLSKGFLDHALLKYQLMIENLNSELSIQKLEKVIDFFKIRSKDQLIEKIFNFYHKDQVNG
jgi:hypothetical protein